MEKSMQIRPIKQSEWTDAMALCWRTFLKYEAPEYKPEGVKNFYQFITDSILEKMFLMGEYRAFGAFEGDIIRGVLGVRDKTHISLLFVEEAYHYQGIAAELMNYTCRYILNQKLGESVTVNSSPYAVGFYHKMGFDDLDQEIEKDGIRYTPMKRNLQNLNK